MPSKRIEWRGELLRDKTVRRRLTPFVVIALIFGAVFGLAVAYLFAKTRRNRKDESETIETGFGRLEYATLGEGAPVLVAHGSGGGYDQSLHMTAPLAEEGFKLIAPSRFGYLRSDIPAEPTPAAQAQAYAALLDHLGIGKTVVLAISAGAWSALHFAKAYPQRCQALVLLVPATSLPAGTTIYGGVMARSVFRCNLLGGLIVRLAALFPRLGASLLGTPIALFHKLPGAERQRLRQLMTDSLPVRAHAQGMALDIDQAQPDESFDFAAIPCPVLAVSTADDAFKTAERAREIVQAVPDGKAIIFETGGHLLVNRLGETVRAVAEFLKP